MTYRVANRVFEAYLTQNVIVNTICFFFDIVHAHLHSIIYLKVIKHKVYSVCLHFALHLLFVEFLEYSLDARDIHLFIHLHHDLCATCK